MVRLHLGRDQKAVKWKVSDGFILCLTNEVNLDIIVPNASIYLFRFTFTSQSFWLLLSNVSLQRFRFHSLNIRLFHHHHRFLISFTDLLHQIRRPSDPLSSPIAFQILYPKATTLIYLRFMFTCGGSKQATESNRSSRFIPIPFFFNGEGSIPLRRRSLFITRNPKTNSLFFIVSQLEPPFVIDLLHPISPLNQWCSLAIQFTIFISDFVHDRRHSRFQHTTSVFKIIQPFRSTNNLSRYTHVIEDLDPFFVKTISVKAEEQHWIPKYIIGNSTHP